MRSSKGKGARRKWKSVSREEAKSLVDAGVTVRWAFLEAGESMGRRADWDCIELGDRLPFAVVTGGVDHYFVEVE